MSIYRPYRMKVVDIAIRSLDSQVLACTIDNPTIRGRRRLAAAPVTLSTRVDKGFTERKDPSKQYLLLEGRG